MAHQNIDRGDRYASWFTAGIAAVAGVWIVVQAGIRIAEVLHGTDVPVLAPFSGEQTVLPIGPGGSDVTVTVDQAVIAANSLAPITSVSLVLEAIVGALGLLGALVCLVLLCINLARGVAFSRLNSRLILLGTTSLLVAWALGGLFRTMGVNGTFAAVSEHSYDNVIFSSDLGPLFAILALGAIGTAFTVGERLQRDTEGLV
ncbi:hypothetical protein [Microbacterium sp. JZ31]|uniref:hypothetical protein n=1 Tax=Microbacterium sp. JZ31 TaxID=1906274 RepID=UPI0019341581|nr:hypothetical protein [Microbacterium sp. JZ31]